MRGKKTGSHVFSARMNQARTLGERFADGLTAFFGSFVFFYLHVAAFLGWIVFNSGLIVGLPVFDPYPFGMLTMLVSLEAIFLSIFVLMSQNRAAKIGDMREEVDLQINVQAEQEITKVLRMLDEIRRTLKMSQRADPELKRMEEKTDLQAIEDDVARDVG